MGLSSSETDNNLSQQSRKYKVRHVDPAQPPLFPLILSQRRFHIESLLSSLYCQVSLRILLLG
jgi:hypothetical protein